MQVSKVDGPGPLFDVLALPAAYGLHCPQLNKLHERFYDTTLIAAGSGELRALHDELILLRDAYRKRREPELVRDRGVRSQDANVRRPILDRLLKDDPTYRAIDSFTTLCVDALASGADLRCEGD